MPRAQKATAALTTPPAPSRGGVILGFTLMIASLAVGIVMILTSIVVWVAQDRFGLPGVLLLLLGVILVSLTIWGKIRIKLGRIEIHLEQNKDTIRRMLFIFVFASLSSLCYLAAFKRWIPGALSITPSMPAMIVTKEVDKDFDIKDFEENQASVPVAQSKALDDWLRQVGSLKNLRIIIEGSADTKEKEALDLAVNRAREVAQLLVLKGVNKSAIHQISGEVGRFWDIPPDDRVMNRRVTVYARGERSEIQSDTANRTQGKRPHLRR